MKRLYSYWTYPFVFFPLLLGFYLTYLLFILYELSARIFLVGAILNITFTALFIGLISIFKRVYVEGSSIYVYDLFSNNPLVIPLSQLRSVERDNSPKVMVLGAYDLTFLLEQGDYKVSIFKNKSIWNLGKYI